MDACDRSDSSPRHETAAVFPKTHWSVVVNAGRIGFPETAAALEELCKTYWSPLYAYLRRKGHSPHDAEDLVQGFLVRILAREDLSDVAPDKGRFRSFLLISLRNFTIKQALHDKAIKRGGGVPQFSLDTAGAEQLCGADLSSESPDLAFDRRWWRTVLALAIQRLRSEYHARGKAALFDTLTPFLDGADAGEYDAAARQLGIPAGTVAVAVHRLRSRLQELVRAEVAQTVSSPEDLDQELKHLIEVWQC